MPLVKCRCITHMARYRCKNAIPGYRLKCELDICKYLITYENQSMEIYTMIIEAESRADAIKQADTMEEVTEILDCFEL